ncbi:MAG: hypothetical protein NTW03_16640 [Verrucomicrobia bacterium]|nr:hypothetical protein [Verrucomicrobiota bacterium]
MKEKKSQAIFTTTQGMTGGCLGARQSNVVAVCLMVLAALTGPLQAGTVYVPNGSFESQVAPPMYPYVTTLIDSWQKAPKPVWFDEAAFGLYWDQTAGLFQNTPPGYPNHIDNLDGNQGLYLLVFPQVALFQDNNSIDWNHTTPTHAFDAQFEVGKSYQLTIGAIGGGGGMTNGVTLELSLYYRDAASNKVVVASTSITNTSAIFSNMTHFIDFQVRVPAVKASDAWAGKNIGVQLLSTASPELAGGYWDLDNVRLTQTIEIPNGSFESPATDFVNTHVDSWQKSPKPDWYVEGGGYYWDQLAGIFVNQPVGNSTHIDNCDGNQALWVFAVPQVGLFQDYNSTDWANSTPLHAFNPQFVVGRSYDLTAGVIGGLGGMLEGLTLELSLYYRDEKSNMVPVAATTITNTLAAFSSTTHLVDFGVHVPAVKASDAWAGKNIGVQVMSTVQPDLAGGYWDVDNVRLSETREPVLQNMVRTNGQFQFKLRSEPGLKFEILAATNVTLPSSNWTSLGILTNVSGANSFNDTSTNLNQRFYRARQLK